MNAVAAKRSESFWTPTTKLRQRTVCEGCSSCAVTGTEQGGRKNEGKRTTSTLRTQNVAGLPKILACNKARGSLGDQNIKLIYLEDAAGSL